MYGKKILCAIFQNSFNLFKQKDFLLQSIYFWMFLDYYKNSFTMYRIF